MRKSLCLGLGIAIVTGLAACIAVPVEDHHRGYSRSYDRDHDGVQDRYDRDRDGDGVPNRYDRRPDNPYRR